MYIYLEDNHPKSNCQLKIKRTEKINNEILYQLYRTNINFNILKEILSGVSIFYGK
jgi:hypothetical protein